MDWSNPCLDGLVRKRKATRRVRSKRAAAPRLVIPDKVANEAWMLSNESLDTLYQSLGVQLAGLDSPMEAKSVAALGVGPNSAILKEKAREFLKEYWGNIRKEACQWWSQNKDKYAGKDLVTKLAVVIAPRIPPPWGLIASIVAIITTILIRAGLDTICEGTVSNEPPN